MLKDAAANRRQALRLTIMDSLNRNIVFDAHGPAVSRKGGIERAVLANTKPDNANRIRHMKRLLRKTSRRSSGARVLWLATVLLSTAGYGLAQPANDNFAQRTAISGSPLSVTGNNQAATREPGEPTSGDKSVWWSWTAPTSGVYTVTAVGLGYFYPFLGVYTGSALSNLVLIASGTFSGSDGTYAARVTLNATGGMTYALAVTTVGGNGGEINLCILPPELPGTPAKFDSITPLHDGSFVLQFRTGAGYVWGIQTSTNLIQWEATYFQFLSNGWYSIRDRPGAVLPKRFYRLGAAP